MGFCLLSFSIYAIWEYIINIITRLLLSKPPLSRYVSFSYDDETSSFFIHLWWFTEEGKKAAASFVFLPVPIMSILVPFPIVFLFLPGTIHTPRKQFLKKKK